MLNRRNCTRHYSDSKRKGHKRAARFARRPLMMFLLLSLAAVTGTIASGYRPWVRCAECFFCAVTAVTGRLGMVDVRGVWLGGGA